MSWPLLAELKWDELCVAELSRDELCMAELTRDELCVANLSRDELCEAELTSLDGLFWPSSVVPTSNDHKFLFRSPFHVFVDSMEIPLSLESIYMLINTI